MNGNLDSFLLYLRTERHASENTVLAYRSDILQFLEFLETPPEVRYQDLVIKDWSELTGRHLETYVEDLEAYEYVQSTIARKVAVLRMFTQWLEAQGYITFDGTKYLHSPKVPRVSPRTLTTKQIQSLFQEPTARSEKPEALRDRTMMELLYATGIRASELLALNVEDIGPDCATIDLTNLDGEARQSSIPEWARPSLQAYIEQAREQIIAGHTEEPALFVNHRGSRLTRQGLWLLCKGYAATLGIESFSPHILRHSFAVHALDKGTPMDEVQAALGHVSRSTTASYKNTDTLVKAE